MFEKTSGKKLTYDADVEIEKEYYLLNVDIFIGDHLTPYKSKRFYRNDLMGKLGLFM